MHLAARNLCLLAASVLVLFAMTCERPSSPALPQETQPSTTQSDTADPGATASSEADAVPDVLDDVQLDFARRPVTYFNDKCGRCHGNYGSYWLEGVLAGLGEERLRRDVDEMAAGPAQSPLEGVALDVQVAYHRSLIDGKPFVSVFQGGSGLAGEVTPGSRVLLITRHGEREARVEEHRWQSEIREASAIRVTRRGQVTDMRLDLPDESASAVIHSHPR